MHVNKYQQHTTLPTPAQHPTETRNSPNSSTSNHVTDGPNQSWRIRPNNPAPSQTPHPVKAHVVRIPNHTTLIKSRNPS